MPGTDAALYVTGDDVVAAGSHPRKVPRLGDVQGVPALSAMSARRRTSLPSISASLPEMLMSMMYSFICGYPLLLSAAGLSRPLFFTEIITYLADVRNKIKNKA